jgi:hypothetical protein
MVYTIKKWYIPWGNLPDGVMVCNDHVIACHNFL